MKRRLPRKYLFVWITLLAAMMALPVWAEETKETEVLDDMVVSATKTKQSIMEAPTNISVIKAEDIAAMNAEKLTDIIKNLPGVYYTNASGFEPRVSFRGTRIGMSEGAKVLVNGIPMAMGKYGYVDWDTIPIENVERVEVIKGPVSSLYGGDAARGAINIVTKRGTEGISGDVNLVAGSYDEYRGKAGVRGTKGYLDYNLMAKYTDQDGYRKESKIEKKNFMGEIGWWLEDSTRLGFVLSANDQERTLAKKLTRDQVIEDRRQPGDLSYTENTDIITGVSIERNQASYDLSGNIYYKNRDKEYENYLLAQQSTPYYEDLDEDVFGGSFQWTLKKAIAEKGNKFTVGLDFDDDSFDQKKLKAESKDPDAPYTKEDPKGSGTFGRTSLGLFIQDEFSILDNVTLTAGLRYDYFEYDLDADYDFSDGGNYPYDSKPDFDKLNPRIGINYLFSRDLSFYASYNQAYRPPTLYDMYSTGVYVAKNAYELKPEEFTQYEVGSRWHCTRWLNVDVSVYRMEIDDMMDSKYDEDGKYQGKQNIGNVEIQGVDVALKGMPASWVTYSIAYSYIDARYGDDTFAKTVPIDDNRLAKWPYNTLNVDLDTTLYDENDIKVLWHNNMNYQDDYALDNLNTDNYKCVTLFNTKLNVTYDRFDVFVAVDNVFDKEYDGYAYISSGKAYYYPAPGATVRGGLTVNF